MSGVVAQARGDGRAPLDAPSTPERVWRALRTRPTSAP